MIGEQVGDDGAGRAHAGPRQAFGLPARHLEHHHLVGLDLVKLGQGRDAHVARQPRGMAAGAHHGVQRGGRGGLAAGAGDAHDSRGGAPAQEHGELHLDPRAGRSRHGERRGIQRHRRVAHHDLGVAKVLEVVAPEDVAHAMRTEALEARGQLGRVAQVRHHERGAMTPQELGHAEPPAVQPQPHHHHAATGERAGAVDGRRDRPIAHGAVPVGRRKAPRASNSAGLSRQTLMTSRATPI